MKSDRKIKVVFDTQIYLRVVINPQSTSSRLIVDGSSVFDFYVAAQIENEILRVLARPKFRAKFSQITSVRVARFLEKLRAKAKYIIVQPEDIEPVCRDPKDDIFLACAKIAEADYLVSEDNDLLVIGQHYTTKIVTVAQFLALLEAADADTSDDSQDE